MPLSASYSFRLAGASNVVCGGVACGAFQGGSGVQLAVAAAGGRVLLQSHDRRQPLLLNFGKEVRVSGFSLSIWETMP